MKQTVKTSRAAGQLEKMFRALNNRFFENKLPEAVITLKKTPGAYGHITCGKTWKTAVGERYEINISTATLARPIENTSETLLHEMCHLYAMENGIKDTSRGTVYHNKRFKEIAENHGLEVEHVNKYGWTITTPSLELLDFIESQGWQQIQMTDGNIFDLLGTPDEPKGTSKGGDDSSAPKVKKPSSTRKYICPKCGCSCRATKTINIKCMDCDEQMVVES